MRSTILLLWLFIAAFSSCCEAPKKTPPRSRSFDVETKLNEAKSPNVEAKPIEAAPAEAAPAITKPAVVVQEITTDALLERIALEGGPALVVNFWATWCPPCLEEWPELERLVERRFPGVEVLAVSLDAPEQRLRRLTPFIEKAPQGMRVLAWKSEADRGADHLIEALGSGWDGELPVTYVFVDGEKRRVFLGPTTFEALEEVLEQD